MVTEIVTQDQTVDDKEFTDSMIIHCKLKEVIMIIDRNNMCNHNHLIIMDQANQHHNQLMIMDHLHNEHHHQISFQVNNNNLGIEDLLMILNVTIMGKRCITTTTVTYAMFFKIERAQMKRHMPSLQENNKVS